MSAQVYTVPTYGSLGLVFKMLETFRQHAQEWGVGMNITLLSVIKLVSGYVIGMERCRLDN